MAVKIVTDSTSYIPKHIAEKYGIEVLSLSVFMSEEIRRELDWSNERFYEEMKKTGIFPKSAQPGIDEIRQSFEKFLKSGEQVLGIFLSSKMSGTYSTAGTVRNYLLEIYPDARIEILDSRTNSMQLGFAAIEAARAASDGAGIDEAVSRAEHVIHNSRFLFTPQTLEYLRKGGRIGGAAALAGQILSIRPVLTVKDGETKVFSKARTKRKAVDAILQKLYEDAAGLRVKEVAVHHINCEEEGIRLADEISRNLGIEVMVESIGPVIGTHVGPGSVGVAYWWQ